MLSLSSQRTWRIENRNDVIERVNKYYRSPYGESFHHPYHFDVAGGDRSREPDLLFAKLDQLLTRCATQGNDQQALDLEIILLNNLRNFGQSTDAQKLPVITAKIQQLCSALGLAFCPQVRLGWECDDRALQMLSDEEADNVNDLSSPWIIDDLKNYYGEGPQTESGRTEWLQSCKRQLVDRENFLSLQAREVLSRNLIIVGSQKVNCAMSNLCDVLLHNSRCWSELGFYLIPLTPMGVVRLADNHQRRSEVWEDRHTGWLHLLRNPWAKRDRFLIYLGGFQVQGTSASMDLLIDILDCVLATFPTQNSQGIPAGESRIQHLLTQGTDFRSPGSPSSSPIPAHLLDACVDLPLRWILHAARPGRAPSGSHLPFKTPPAFEGSNSGYTIVPFGESS